MSSYNKIILAQHRKVLFWAKRLTYYSADTHPEWRIKYNEEKKKLNMLKELERR